MKNKKERKEEYRTIDSALNIKKERKWLCQHGKGDLLDFTENEIAKLRQCFNELDEDGGGSIGLDELEEPLIGLGIANSREEVENMIKLIDDDGDIEF